MKRCRSGEDEGSPSKKRKTLRFAEEAPEVFEFEKVPGERANMMGQPISIGISPRGENTSNPSDLKAKMFQEKGEGNTPWNWDGDEERSEGVRECSEAEIADAKRRRKLAEIIGDSNVFSAEDLEGEIDISAAMDVSAASLPENHQLNRPDDVDVVPFDMSDMQGEGRMDEDGNFIMGRGGEKLPEMKDPWVVDNLTEDEATLEKTRKAARAKELRIQREEDRQGDAIPFRNAVAILGHVDIGGQRGPELPEEPLLLTADETPTQAMQRLKGIPACPKARKKMKMAPRLDKVTRGRIDHITELCQVIFEHGQSAKGLAIDSPYTTAKKTFAALAPSLVSEPAVAEEESEDLPAPPSSSSDDEIEEKVSENSSDSDEVPEITKPTEKPPATSLSPYTGDESWYYMKESDITENGMDGAPLNGAVTTTEIRSWIESGILLKDGIRLAQGDSPLTLPDKEEFRSWQSFDF